MISFVGSAAAPLMVVAALTSTAWAVTGFVAIPLVFVLIGVVLALFAVGYTAMARKVTNAGALYSYIAHGLGTTPGVGAAAVAMLAYNGLQIGLYGVFGSVAAGLLDDQLGVPWWGCALAAWAIVTALGQLRIDVNGRVLTTLLAAECGMILLADAVMLAHPAGGSISLAALNPAQLATTALGAPIVVTATAFVGFEAPTVYAEEARDPDRSVPVATFTALGLIAGLYALTSWALTVTIGPGQIVAAAGQQGPQLLFHTIAAHLSPLVATLGQVLLITSVFAGLLAFHNTVARYTFALGRERVLPAACGRTNRSGAPAIGSMLQSGLGLVVLVVAAIAGLDPMVEVFFTFGTGGGLGVLLLLAVTSISVLAFFARDAVGPLWRTRWLPLVAALALVGGVGLAVINIDTLLGVPAGSLLTWLIPLLYLTALTGGLGWARWLRARHPSAYAAVGRGADAQRSSLDHSPRPPVP